MPSLNNLWTFDRYVDVWRHFEQSWNRIRGWKWKDHTPVVFISFCLHALLKPRIAQRIVIWQMLGVTSQEWRPGNLVSQTSYESRILWVGILGTGICTRTEWKYENEERRLSESFCWYVRKIPRWESLKGRRYPCRLCPNHAPIPESAKYPTLLDQVSQSDHVQRSTHRCCSPHRGCSYNGTSTICRCPCGGSTRSRCFTPNTALRGSRLTA